VKCHLLELEYRFYLGYQYTKTTKPKRRPVPKDMFNHFLDHNSKNKIDSIDKKYVVIVID